MGYYSYNSHKYYPGRKEKKFLWIFSILCIIWIPALCYFYYLDYKATERSYNIDSSLYNERVKELERQKLIEDSIQKHIRDSLEIMEFNEKIQRFKK